MRSCQLDPFRVDQSDIRLVDECGGLKAMAAPLTPHAANRDAMQLIVYERHQLLQGRLIALPPFQQ